MPDMPTQAQEKHAEALRFFQRATQLDPNSFDAWFNLGYTLGELKQATPRRYWPTSAPPQLDPDLGPRPAKVTGLGRRGRRSSTSTRRRLSTRGAGGVAGVPTMVAFVTRIVASFSALDTPPVPNLLENGQSLVSFFLVTAGLGGLINLVRLFTPKGRMRGARRRIGPACGVGHGDTQHTVGDSRDAESHDQGWSAAVVSCDRSKREVRFPVGRWRWSEAVRDAPARWCYARQRERVGEPDRTANWCGACRG